jgi:hypothetical protein
MSYRNRLIRRFALTDGDDCIVYNVGDEMNGEIYLFLKKDKIKNDDRMNPKWIYLNDLVDIEDDIKGYLEEKLEDRAEGFLEENFTDSLIAYYTYDVEKEDNPFKFMYRESDKIFTITGAVEIMENYRKSKNAKDSIFNNAFELLMNKLKEVCFDKLVAANNGDDSNIFYKGNFINFQLKKRYIDSLNTEYGIEMLSNFCISKLKEHFDLDVGGEIGKKIEDISFLILSLMDDEMLDLDQEDLSVILDKSKFEINQMYYILSAIKKMESQRVQEMLLAIESNEDYEKIVEIAANDLYSYDSELKESMLNYENLDFEPKYFDEYIASNKIDVENISKSKILKLLEINPNFLKNVLKSSIEATDEMLSIALSREGSLLKDVLEAGINPSQELVLAAAKNTSIAIRYALGAGIEISNESLLDLIKNNGYSIRFILESGIKPSDEMLLETVKKDGYSIRFILEVGIKPSEEVLMEAIKENSSAIIPIVDNGITPTKEMFLTAIENNENTNLISAIVESGVQLSEDLLMAAVTKNGNSIAPIVRAGIQPSQELMLEAVKKNGTAIYHILKGRVEVTPQILLEAVKATDIIDYNKPIDIIEEFGSPYIQLLKDFSNDKITEEEYYELAGQIQNKTSNYKNRLLSGGYVK